ncbi:MAG TPA: FAD-linked oxidase C-terminal domain-containing protein [Pirellulales bacterium]|nr:FAD-linked oxidase C-terminal domain-containing protein [Pirellulales bacterium]
MQSLPTVSQPEQRTTEKSPDVDAVALASELRRQIAGDVRFDAGSRAMYSTDSAIFRRIPIGVVLPRDADDVAATLALCRQYGAPVLPRGGGTSISGNSCNVAVVIDMSKHMNRILEIDAERKIARVEPGVICDSLRHAAERFHLTFAPDPSTHNRCNLGGMIGNNSCGSHSMMGGRTVDNIDELDIITYDGARMRVGPASENEINAIVRAADRRGEIYARLRMLGNQYRDLVRERYPRIPRQCSGYCLDQLLPEKGFHVARSLVGSEGTCVVVLEATCRLIHSPPERLLVVAGFADIATAGDHVPLVREHAPLALEGVDDYLVDALRAKAHQLDKLPLLPAGRSWLYIELGADDHADVLAQAQRLVDRLRRQPGVVSAELFDDPKVAKRLWDVRHEGLALSRVPGAGDLWPGWEDGAVAPERVGDYLRELRRLIDSFGYVGPLFAHLGQGCIHTRTNFDLTSTAGIAKYRAFMEAAADLVVRHGGSLSGEHGDGRFRSELLVKMFGEELVNAFRRFKAIWDPDRKMNPGIKVDADPLDAHLRLGADYAPRRTATHFRFPDDGDFASATVRCIGLGECRREQMGVMCPSYQATREEMHSTRGRARLLFEMLQGNPVKDGWRDEHVRESLDLCLACKGCKSECPANVDMATYKAEFLSHYYAGRLRPRSAYAMGLIHWWARAASRMPEVVNAVTQSPLLGPLLKRLGGISPRRQVPVFAPESFQAWFRRRPAANAGRSEVILWPDTFTNYFEPEIAKASVEVLEDAGFRVVVPDQVLCCGRPLYDFGMLVTAKRLISNVLSLLREPIRLGVPVVGLEPSCVAVFRDEMPNLFPHDMDVRRLAQQTFTLGEFLATVPGYQPPRLRRRAIIHGHCHHKAIMRMGGEEKILQGMRLDYGQILDSGCCGMAGSFGFEAGHYDISMKIGAQRLFPAVENADRDALIVADGFSCRHQIAEATDRRALHLAQVMKLALDCGPDGPIGGFPEVRYPPVRLDGPERLKQTLRTAKIGGLCLAGIVAAGLAARWMRNAHA